MVQRRTTVPTAHKVRAPASRHTTLTFESYLCLKKYVDLSKGLAAMLVTKKSVGSGISGSLFFGNLNIARIILHLEQCSRL